MQRKRSIKHYFFITLVIVLHFNTYNIYSQTYDSCLYNIIANNKEKSDSLLHHIKNESDKLFLRHYGCFFDVALGKNNKIKICQDIEEKFFNTTNTSEIILSQIYLHKGIISYMDNSKIDAILSFLKAYNYYKKCMELYPENIETQKLKGIFNILLSELPYPHNKFANLLGYSGNKNIGFKALNRYVNKTSSPGQHEEALIYLAFATLKFQESSNIVKEFICKYAENSNSQIFNSVLIRCALKIRQPLLVNNLIYSSDIKDNINVLLYSKIKHAAICNKSDKLNLYARAFLNNKNNIQYKADVLKYLAWDKFIIGDTVSYYKYKDSIINLKDYRSFYDKKALKEISNNIPDANIIKAHLCFDAGEYNKALNLLKKNKQSVDVNNMQEFYYRLGRCNHLLGNIDDAKDNYKKSVEINSNNYYTNLAKYFLKIADND